MSKYENVEVPLRSFGNRVGFADQQLVDDWLCREFFERWRHCFERDYTRQVWLLKPQERAP